MDYRYRCYYCNVDFTDLQPLIDHCFEQHSDQTLKYRVRILYEQTGTFKLQTKTHDGIVPSDLLTDGKYLFVRDEKTYIINTNNKVKKLNTPLKENETRRQLFNKQSSNITNENNDVSSLPSAQCDMDSSQEENSAFLRQINDNDNSADSDKDTKSQSALNELFYILPGVLKTLESAGQLDLYLKFNRLLSENIFPMDNICYLLFLDLVQWFSCSNTSQMRYNEHTIKFWQIGYRLFHGKYLRFMSGLKNCGQILEGESTRGLHDPVSSRINFAVPSRNNLYQNSSKGRDLFLPGINENSIKIVAEIFGDKPMKIAVDGKKISRGKGKIMGDIDCWGFESDPCLLDRKEQFKEETSFVAALHERMETFEESGLCNIEIIPQAQKSKLTLDIKSLLKCICHRIKLLREQLSSLERSEQKFRSLGKDDWRQSKYYPVICFLRVNIVDVKKLIDEALTLSNRLLYFGATMQGTQNMFSILDSFVMENQENYMRLNESYVSSNSRYQQQKSDMWFETRNQAAVTGSTLNSAIGLSTLKKQKEHYDAIF